MRYGELHRRLREGSGSREVAGWAARTLSRVASGSLDVAGVLHPLGFLCLPVERSGRTGVCLHLWSPELPPPASTTSAWHCHSWSLLSLLLYGRLGNELGELGEPEEGTGMRVFEVLSRDGVDELRATPRTVRVSPVDGGTYTRGDVYTLPAGVFHRTVVAGEAATVALGAEHPGLRDLSLGPLGLGGHRVRRRRQGAGRTARLARRAAELLQED
ncbi:hypothetical protein [Actinocorallia populi]|uniref:hypothetical protein n=1 Tax=Actinocorallia populi TaxID=2079200 RepID=UPI000D089126|nr:hypothetical protein [Actinocorallia populi]